VTTRGAGIVEGLLEPGEVVGFEAGFEGFPPLSLYHALAAVVLVSAGAASLGRAMVPAPGLPLGVPVILPALVFLAAVELVYVARWRSTTLVATDRRLLVFGGALS